MDTGEFETNDLTLLDLFRKFPNDAAAEKWFEKKRWPNGICCPKCNSDNIQVGPKHPDMPYRCRTCRKFFSVKTDTAMHSSKLGYQTWAVAIFLIMTRPKGYSSVQLGKDLGISQKSAWHLAHRLRQTWDYQHDKMVGEVEVDEAYFGGKERNKHSRKKLRSGRGAVGKIPVVGARERWSGDVVAAPVERTDIETLTDFVEDNVEIGAKVYTDEYRSYNDLGWDYDHRQVAHKRGEYVNGDIHTNGIESFWALLKRGYYGTYHWMSKKHLHRYVNEFTGRQNSRHLSITYQMERMARRMDGERLTYLDLTG
ncbi:MAG: IS1595 family transposase [Caldilineaceae bacterium]|nr:IS1595 family transposase [Caldilineaceae bacterium]